MGLSISVTVKLVRFSNLTDLFCQRILMPTNRFVETLLWAKKRPPLGFITVHVDKDVSGLLGSLDTLVYLEGT